MKTFLIGLVFASGCVVEGKPSDSPPNDQQPPTQQPRTAQQMFEQDVFPIMSTDCSSCHEAATPTTLDFMTTNATTTYQAIITNRSLVGDFTPGTAAILQVQNMSGHQPVRYTTAEVAKITAWLAQEVAERR